MKPSTYKIQTDFKGELFVMPKPSGEWLDDDVKYYKEIGFSHIVSMLENDEVCELGLQNEEAVCLKYGMVFSRLPIQDRGLPEKTPFTNMAKQLGDELTSGKTVAIHCRAGIGRAGLLACCVLKELGWSGVEALKIVSQSRGVRVPDTPDQRDYILDYQR